MSIALNLEFEIFKAAYSHRDLYKFKEKQKNWCETLTKTITKQIWFNTFKNTKEGVVVEMHFGGLCIE